jgi:hypothetical protein
VKEPKLDWRSLDHLSVLQIKKRRSSKYRNCNADTWLISVSRYVGLILKQLDGRFEENSWVSRVEIYRGATTGPERAFWNFWSWSL